LVVIAAVLLVVAACTETMTVAANFPAYFSDQKIFRDIGFGSAYGSKLDVYRPDDRLQTHPVIVFFYGGAWKSGEKSAYRFVADAFTKRGYVVVIADYVKYPRVKYPAWQDDAAKAVVWAHENIIRYGGDASNLFVMGHSAGAHIGAMLVTDNEYLARNGGDKSWVRAFAGLAGPYDFVPDEKDYIDMFGPPERYPLMQVANYVDGRQPPMLLLWGKDDKTVGEVNITRLVSAIRDKGGLFKVKYYDGVDHIDIIAALTRIERDKAPVLDDVDLWFKKYQ